MPHHHMVIPHYMGQERDVSDDSKQEDINPRGLKRQESLSSRSSYQDIPLLLPQEPDGVDKVSRKPKMEINQNLAEQRSKPNHSSAASAFSFRKTKVEHTVPDMQMKGFVDDTDSYQAQGDGSYNGIVQDFPDIDKEWWEAQERGDKVISTEEVGQVGPRTPCRCQVKFFDKSIR